jgi:hypothetical protein
MCLAGHTTTAGFHQDEAAFGHLFSELGYQTERNSSLDAATARYIGLKKM